jgi:hypothetical protein
MAAVQRLPADVTSGPDFQVVFLGAEASVDGATSSQWIRQQAERFTWSYEIHANTPHDRAMEIISKEGNLLVLATMVDVSRSWAETLMSPAAHAVRLLMARGLG